MMAFYNLSIKELQN